MQAPPVFIPSTTNLVTKSYQGSNKADYSTPVVLALISKNHATNIPVTVIIMDIPSYINDDLLKRILECCGKIKVYRRTSNNRDILRPYCFVTFDTGLGALRCYRNLHKINFGLHNTPSHYMSVKVGSKEESVLTSLSKDEKDIIASIILQEQVKIDSTLSADANGDTDEIRINLDEPIKVLIENLFQSKIKESDPGQAKSAIDRVSDGQSMSKHLMDLALVYSDNPDSDPPLSKPISDEIEAFRSRVSIRDKEIEDKKKMKMREKIDASTSALRRNDHAAAIGLSSHVSYQSDSKARDVLPESMVQRKKDYDDGMDEVEREERRKRKLQVLEMLATDDSIVQKANEKSIEVSFVKKNVKKGLNNQLEFFQQEQNEPVRQFVKLYDDEHGNKLASEKERENQQSLDKMIIDSLPTTKEELFAYSIDYKIVIEHNIVTSLKPWIDKKLVHYLGAPLPDLNDYICNNINSGCSPEYLVKELFKVFDNDCEQFVMLLWRYLLFLFLKAKSGH